MNLIDSGVLWRGLCTLALFVSLNLLGVSASLAAPLKTANFSLETLKQQYLKLRNTDVEIKRRAEWEQLAEDLEKGAMLRRRDKAAPGALLDAAILNEQLYRRFSEPDRLARSLALFERLARDYPGDRLSDDALLRRGDLLAETAGKDSAKRAYEEIVQAYANGDMAGAARARLDALAGKTAKREPIDAAAHKENPLGPVIVLDAGHGGEDFGAVGYGGLLEKDAVLAIALQLEKLLREKLGAVVRMTRRTDVFVPLAERTNMANDFDAALFVSLHANASPKHKLSGIETYYLDNTGDQGSLKLAERENQSGSSDQAAGDLQFMLSDLIQNAKLEESIQLARSIHNALRIELQPHWKIGKDYGVKKAPFFVLVGAHMPCILVELGFIDHPVDGANLGESDFRRSAAHGIFSGIKKFLAAGTANAK
ncbi:MAG: N-acetylmuramoyl-L-alanine amidase [Oligoflexia bacterium]|nr:N-acetylmuramoyl-L-alanine amidase [Oligoflexia bacterium]